MASSSPMTSSSHSHHHHLLNNHEMEICLKSESSFSDDDVRPRMVVEVTLIFSFKFAIPAAVEGGFHDLDCYVMPTECHACTVDNPLQYFSALEDPRRSIASLFRERFPQEGGIFRCLEPELSRLAHETLKRAEVEGRMGMKMIANSVCTSRVDRDTAVRLGRVMDRGGSRRESLGTCSVCLDETRRECIWTVKLACSHVFHLKCMDRWLRRQNSCPLCRSKQPIVFR